MNFLLDTCVLSELIKNTPAKNVTGWLMRQSEQNLFISVLTIGEIVKGIQRLPQSIKKAKLNHWLENDLLNRFEKRIYDVDYAVAAAWGRLAGESEAKGKIITPVDGLIAATAEVHGCILVTRNIEDMPLESKWLLNPWNAA